MGKIKTDLDNWQIGEAMNYVLGYQSYIKDLLYNSSCGCVHTVAKGNNNNYVEENLCHTIFCQNRVKAIHRAIEETVLDINERTKLEEYLLKRKKDDWSKAEKEWLKEKEIRVYERLCINEGIGRIK